MGYYVYIVNYKKTKYYLLTGGIIVYKRLILELLGEIEEMKEDDIIFLRQIYTMIKKHIEKRKSR